MNGKQLKYLKKISEIYCKDDSGIEIMHMLRQEELIRDYLFYDREYKLQSELNNPLITRSYGRLLNANEKLIKEPIMTKMFLESLGTCEIEYPNNSRLAVCLTHDVDVIYPSLYHTFLSSAYCIKHLQIKKMVSQLVWRSSGKEFSPYRNFREIMDLEEKFDAKSSFYFLASDEDIKGFRYNIMDLENELGSIIDRGWEVGLHGGYYSFNDQNKIKKEKKRLEKILCKNVIGYRNHYLQFKIPGTWNILKEAGFKYDTTFGYNDMAGFRNGMCHPFEPFNLDENEEIDILEIPLTIGDGILISYIKDLNKAWNTVKELIDTTEKYNGVLTLLYHNNIFNCPYRYNWIKLYKKILGYCYEKKAWMTSGEEIWEWWKNGYKAYRR